MRRLLSSLAALLILGLLSAPPALAAPDDGPGIRRPSVALLPVINNSGQKRTQYMVGMINESLQAQFSPDRCLVIIDQTLDDALRRQGIDDFRTVDSYTLNNALQALGVDYSVRTEILAVATRQKVYFPDVFLLMKSWAAQVPVNFAVTNVRTGEVIYAATFSEYAKHDAIIGFNDRHYAIRFALAKVLEKFAQEQIGIN
ncbi:MAG TPA: hypothetical protein VN521_09745 [Negativicutes bacterium]|nr:hypothetical protein [Negativicutes bacterium]